MNWYTYALFGLVFIAAIIWGHASVEKNKADWPVEDDENNPLGDASLLSRDGRH